MSVVGKPIDRVDAIAKVTGRATFTADVAMPDVVFAVIASSTISKGRVASIDVTRARGRSPAFSRS